MYLLLAIARYTDGETTSLLREEGKQELRAERGPFYREPVAHKAHGNRHMSGPGT